MAVTQTPRFGMTRWGADTDPQDRADFVDALDAIEALGAKLSQLGVRNRLVNGDLRVNQRAYVSAAALALNAYSFDRWKATVAIAGGVTFVAAPSGQLVTIPSAGQVAQIVERANMPAGRYILSHAGTANARVYNVGAGAPAFAATPLVVDIDGLADVTVEFQAHGGASKTFGKAQLEQVAAGALVADVTPFEVRPLGAELALCQRYFHRWAPTTLQIVGSGLGAGGSGRIGVRHPVTMRAAPTLTIAGAAAGWTILRPSDGGLVDPNSFGYSIVADAHSFHMGVDSTGNLGTGVAFGIQSDAAATNYIDVSAEL